jgi:tRNA-specific 2-thiouridylase
MPKRVLVAMSGGVDSSVAAALLKEQGYDLVGVTMQVWPSQPGRVGGCCSIEAVSDAQKVAAALGIPHYTLNYRDYFQKVVINDFIEEYRAGRTPNPCIRCNQFLKFDALLKKADELQCDLIATGHYAKIFMDENGGNHLYRGYDHKKDQSYVLYVMTQEALKRTLFPLDGIEKPEVRRIAIKYNFAVADKPDSQEICFVEDDNYVNFLKENVPGVVKPGEIVDSKGKVVGRHEGIAFYTIGQRKGIGFFGFPMYVIKIDPKNNQVVIGNRQEASTKELMVSRLNYPGGDPFNSSIQGDSNNGNGIRGTVKIRSKSPEEPATISAVGDDKVKITFDQPQFAVTPGQSAVFYLGDEVLGGGIIEV